jgi:tRNA dimethylallyltransferase
MFHGRAYWLRGAPMATSEGHEAKMAAAEKVLVIGGPTASGKSALALALAERLDGVVVNADSMQVYRELPILTAQPDAATQARAPHALYGILGIDERCSAGRWQALARAGIAEAQGQGRLPVVVGGTGLYLRALMGGLADIPAVPEEIRAGVQARLAEMGPAAFHAELAARDPEMAAKLNPNDRQRLTRAAEVLAATGRSLADWQRDAAAAAPAADFRTVLVAPPRDDLYAACDGRFEAMLAAGALDEAAAVGRQIAADGLAEDLPALKALGLRELLAHLAGNLRRRDAIEAAKMATRHYAKRQMTWFKGQFLARYTIDKKLNEQSMADYAKKISDFFLTLGN